MTKLFFIPILLAPLLTTCTHRWVAYPQNVKNYEKCQTLDSGPQMLKIPGYAKSYIMVHNCDEMDRQRVSIAITVFLEEWEKVHRNKLKKDLVEKTMHNLLIEFSQRTRLANVYDVNGNYVSQASVSGLALSPTMAWIQVRPGVLLCQTSFIHELMHLSIWAIKGTDGDPDHMGNEYKGWNSSSMVIIQNTNERLCTLGI